MLHVLALLPLLSPLAMLASARDQPGDSRRITLTDGGLHPGADKYVEFIKDGLKHTAHELVYEYGFKQDDLGLGWYFTLITTKNLQTGAVDSGPFEPDKSGPDFKVVSCVRLGIEGCQHEQQSGAALTGVPM